MMRYFHRVDMQDKIDTWFTVKHWQDYLGMRKSSSYLLGFS